MDQDATLTNPRRQLILRYLEQHPGARFYELKDELEIPHGPLVHHLRVLRRQGLVVFDRDGRQVRLRLPGQNPRPPLAPDARRLVDELASSPGLTIEELALRLGWTRRKTSYWAHRLLAAGRVRDHWRGRAHLLAPTPQAVA